MYGGEAKLTPCVSKRQQQQHQFTDAKYHSWLLRCLITLANYNSIAVTKWKRLMAMMAQKESWLQWRRVRKGKRHPLDWLWRCGEMYALGAVCSWCCMLLVLYALGAVCSWWLWRYGEMYALGDCEGVGRCMLLVPVQLQAKGQIWGGGVYSDPKYGIILTAQMAND